MSQRQDIFDFDDIDVFEQPIQQPYKSPVREQVPQQQQQKSQQMPQQTFPKPSSKQLQPQQHSLQRIQKGKKVANRFSLTDQQKINISKRLPKGFVLLKKGQPIQNFTPFKGDIEYVPIKKPPKIASEQLLQKFPISVLSTMNPKKDIQKKVQKPGLRLSSGQLPQGKSKQTQKVKGVLMKFRKHPRYPQLAQQLNKLGLMQGFTEIESQIKKNIHTIDSFKDRCLYILNQAKLATPSQSTTEVINELIDEFMFQIQQAKKLQFQNNLLAIQKNIDKITREITDIRQSGSWYLRKKKRTQKSFDEKQVMYIADLVRQLPPAYLVGVWQIIEQRPFLQSQQKQIQISFSQLKTKKIREIESYVKRKHNTYMTSRDRKREKIRRKMELEGVSNNNLKGQQQESLMKKQQGEEELGITMIKEEQQKAFKKEEKNNSKQNIISQPSKLYKLPSLSQQTTKQSQQKYSQPSSYMAPIDQLQSFLSVEDIQKPQQKIIPMRNNTNNQQQQQLGIFTNNDNNENIMNDKQRRRGEQKMMVVDDFLQLDDMLMLQEQQDIVGIDNGGTKIQDYHQDARVPPTPRFSSLDNNPQIINDDQFSSMMGNKKQKSRLNVNNTNNNNDSQIQQQKQVQQFQMQQPDLRIPQRIDNDSSDSSFITDDEDSDY